MSKEKVLQWEQMTKTERDAMTDKQIQDCLKNGTLNVNSKKTTVRGYGGRREDLNNRYFRSSWEANYARYLNFIKVKWEYEPKTFYFEGIKRGTLSYTPDFYLPEEDKWIEIKGWMDDKSKTKLKRFEKYYPEESAKLQIVGEKEYKEIVKGISALIPFWE